MNDESRPDLSKDSLMELFVLACIEDQVTWILLN